jgi:hypothetical protein
LDYGGWGDETSHGEVLESGNGLMEVFQAGMLLSTWIEAMAVNAEIEAMKAANIKLLFEGFPPCHDDTAFQEKANYLWALSTQAQSQVR